ncbi:MAG: RNA polymerase sigma factor [Gammaproteobacteria bacterium]
MRRKTENRVDRPNSSIEDSDEALIARVARQDRAALTSLYRRYHGPILRFVQRLTGDVEIANEAVNDVMLVVWERATSFAGKSKVSTWIMGIAYRKAMKLSSRRQRWLTRFKAADWSEVIERSGDLEGLTKEVVERDLLYRALQRLPAKQRAVVELTYFFGYSYEEIAEIVDCPANTVKTRMFHARAKLKELLPRLGHGVRD